MGEARVLVPAEVPLEDPPVLRAVEQRPPRFQLPDAFGGFPGVQLDHAPVVQILPAAHRVGEMDLPAVALVHVGQGRGDPPFGHDRVRLSEKRLADQPDRHSRRGGLDRRPETRPAGADHQHVMVVGLEFRHQMIRQSEMIPMEQRRT